MTATQYRPTSAHLSTPEPAAPLRNLPLYSLPIYSLEVISPSGRAPHLDGWTVQTWPVASLGDLTVQARPHGAASPDDLRAALTRAGFTPLGPVRTHR
ncbi:hypothetical protein [Deinococcus sp. UR1]|uniref:hypothetical protein n=1 Tax=Deinococcus sp. UR1 TaxID=1704277 RepID=UPI000C19EF80|nr:hypothetical protein [Deinococcus sp. UR1]PIG97931.1 hypothetical protein AMD26_010465 [Deinococcus sp. UR1]